MEMMFKTHAIILQLPLFYPSSVVIFTRLNNSFLHIIETCMRYIYYVSPQRDCFCLVRLSVWLSVRLSVCPGIPMVYDMSICENFPFIPLVSYWVVFRLLGSFKQRNTQHMPIGRDVRLSVCHTSFPLNNSSTL